MKELDISVAERRVVNAAIKKTQESNVPACAIDLGNKIVYGKKSPLFSQSAACIINALKSLAKIPQDMLLLSKAVIEPIQDLKSNSLKRNNRRLNLNNVLIALAITATTNEMAKAALNQLPKLRGLELHSSVMIGNDDLEILKKLGIHTTMGTFQDTKLLKTI